MWSEKQDKYRSAEGEKACPVRLRSGQALSEGEGTLCWNDRVSPVILMV